MHFYSTYDCAGVAVHVLNVSCKHTDGVLMMVIYLFYRQN